MRSNLATFILGALVIILMLKNCTDTRRFHKEEQSNLNLISALNDSIKIIKHKDSSSTARIKVLETSSAKDFIELQIKDKAIEELQSVVKQYKKSLKPGSSVTVGSIKTEDTLKTHTPPAIVKSDTVRKDSLVYIYPTYKDSVDNGFTKVVGTMGKDSADFAVSISNDFSAVVGYDKKTPFIDFNLKNPHSTVTKLRTYQVSIPPPKKWGIGPNVGYGISQELKQTLFIGVSLQYNLIRF